VLFADLTSGRTEVGLNSGRIQAEVFCLKAGNFYSRPSGKSASSTSWSGHQQELSQFSPAPAATKFPATLEQLVAAERDNVEQLEAEVEDDMDFRDALADQAWMDDLAAALDDLEPMDLAD